MLPNAWAYHPVSTFKHPTDQTVQTGPFGAQLHSDDYVDEGVPFILIRNMIQGGVDDRDMPRITQKDANRLSNYSLKLNDIVFSRVGRVGSCFLVEPTHVGWVISGQLLRLRLDLTNLDPHFLIHWIRSHYIERHIGNESVGSTRQSINSTILARLPVPDVPVREQRQIAQVLGILDSVIHDTEAIIAKHRALKQGLLHDLLTRGIHANGELRLPQVDAPHLYKPSPLGWIPKEWACKPFGELCESSAFGPRFPSDAYDENGPLATLRTTDMDDEGDISPSTMPRAAIAPSVFADHLLRPGDIVISRSGTCGVTGVFAGHDIPVVPGAFLIRFRLRDLRLNRFYRRYFNSSIGRPCLERLAVGGVQKNIKGSDVLCLQVPAPMPTEAVDIAERIESVEHDVESNQQLLAKFQLQNSGLMDDLLTGRVRVTSLLAEGGQRQASA